MGTCTVTARWLCLPFIIDVLVLAHVAGWQVLRLYVPPIYATLILLGVDLVGCSDFWHLGCKILAEPR
jgi:hypothetical protein